MAPMSCLLRQSLGPSCFRRTIPVGLGPPMPAPWTGKADWTVGVRTKLPADAKKVGCRTLRDCLADVEAAEHAQRGKPVAEVPRDAVTPELDHGGGSRQD